MQKTLSKAMRIVVSWALAIALVPAAAFAVEDDETLQGNAQSFTEAQGSIDATVDGSEIQQLPTELATESSEADEPSTAESQNDLEAQKPDDSSLAEPSEESPEIAELLAEDKIASNEVIVVYHDDPIDLVTLAEEEMPTVEVVDQEEIASSDSTSLSIDVATLSEDTTITDAIEELAADPAVAFVQPNYMYDLFSVTPNDPYYNRQYYLPGCGFDVAWEKAKCQGSSTVAVIDSGCNYSHPDLQNQTLSSLAWDATTSSSLPTSNDLIGHGTTVGGVIGAQTNNGAYVTGATYNANILPVKVFDSQGNCYTSYVINAITYILNLIDQKKVSNLHVMNFSLGAYQDDPAMHAILANAKDDYQILSVCAGGNGDSKSTAYTAKSFPSDYDECMAVTSLTSNDTDSVWSDYNQYKDISAPGEGIITTGPSGNVVSTGGTSLSSPIVSAAAALLWAYRPSLSVDDVFDLLTSTASPINGTKRPTNGSVGKLEVGAAMAKLSGGSSGSNPSTAKTVAKPALSRTLAYNGAMQRGVPLSAGYTVSGRVTATNAGSYVATVTPKEGYVWADDKTQNPISVSWTIQTINVSALSVSGVAARYAYTGSALKPKPVLKIGSSTLGENFQYSLSYASNVYPGTATITIKGIGNCTGQRTVSFAIGTNAEQFVTRLYSLVLSRNPDVGGLRNQVAALNAGVPAAQIAWGFFESPEFAGKNITNAQRVETAYKAMLDRTADSSGKAQWTEKLDVGMTMRFIIAGFAQSNEFRSLCARWGINPGSLGVTENRDRSYNATAFVQRLYQKVMNRTGDAGGLNTHTGSLLSGTPAVQLAWSFFSSPEFARKSLSNGDRVSIAYNTMLDRSPDSSGKAQWTEKLDTGMTMRFIIAGFAQSNEFRSLCAKWGLNPGSLGVTENRDRNYNATAFVQRLYRNVMSRTGDAGGLNTHTGSLLSGGHAAQLAWAFFGSAEFSNRTLTNEHRVEIAYNTMLNRDPDSNGKASWIRKLDAGMPIYLLIAGFSESNEFQRLCQSYGITAGRLPYDPAEMAKYNSLPTTGTQTESKPAALSVSFSYPEPIKCGQTTTITFNATGGNGNYLYMPYSLMVKNGSAWEEAVNLTYQKFTAQNTFEYEFVMSGEYRFTVAAMDPPNYSYMRFSTQFTISADQGPTPAQRKAMAEAKANEVWAQCQAAGKTTDYEKALWLHDWIVDNCEYDYSLIYCKDVDLFVNGKGTCEAYHSAYMKLLGKAGIECGRVYDSGHVWTLVKMDGKWYHVDTTHDDTAGKNWFGLGDDEKHLYFGLTDKIIEEELAVEGGSIQGESIQVTANSLDSNYFIKSGRVKQYSSYFTQDIQSKLNAGTTSFSIATPTRLASASADLPPKQKLILYSIVAYDLANTSWTANGKSVSLAASYANGSIDFKIA